MTESIDVPATLRTIRASLDLTQEQLAERLGVSFASINRWEGGAAMPQKAAREAIAALAAESGIDPAVSSTEAAARVTRRRPRGKAVPSTKPMEQMLWDAACSIRGDKDAAKFKDYLLPLLFLKRLSDVFDDEIKRMAMVEDYDGNQALALEIVEKDHDLVRFYLPPEARWEVINGRASHDWPPDEHGQGTTPRDIGEHLTKAVRAVVRHNPTLAGVIDLVDFAAERNGERDINPAKLTAVVETFSDPRYRLGLADVQPDFLGRAYEYLLRKFAEGSGQSAGEFFTPTEVGFLMAHLMRPRPGETCHDYACGSAGLLVKLQLVARRLDPASRSTPLRLSGQELQAESYAVARMNAIIHDMDVDIRRGDTMINPKFKTVAGRIKAHDVVVANPMWNQSFNPDVFANDPFDRFRTQGGVTTGKGDWAWLQHTVACLNERGRAAVVLDTGAVTRGSGAKHEDRERNIRKWFVTRDLIDGVILLPDNLFYNTSAAGIIVVVSKNKPAARKDRIVLLNAGRRVRKGRPKNFIPEDHIRPLAAAYHKGEPVEGEIAVITRQQAKEADYNLIPSRWVGSTETNEGKTLKDLVEAYSTISEKERALDAQVGSIIKILQRIQKLFARGLRGEPQKHTEIGPLPESWEVQPLGNHFEIVQGLSLKGNLATDGTGVPFLRTSNVYWGRIDLSKISRMNVETTAIRDLQSGDLLVCEGGEIGRAAIWSDEIKHCTYQNHVYRLRPTANGKADPKFVMRWLEEGFCHRQIYEGAGNKTTIPNLSRSRLSELRIPIATLDEQKEIVAILDAIDRKIDLHRKKRSVLTDLFKTLLHQLMTGELQVRDLDLSVLSDAKIESPPTSNKNATTNEARNET